MLVDLECTRGHGIGARHLIAHDLGVDERTVRRRPDRTPRALRNAGPAYLAEVEVA